MNYIRTALLFSVILYSLGAFAQTPAAPDSLNKTYKAVTGKIPLKPKIPASEYVRPKPASSYIPKSSGLKSPPKKPLAGEIKKPAIKVPAAKAVATKPAVKTETKKIASRKETDLPKVKMPKIDIPKINIKNSEIVPKPFIGPYGKIINPKPAFPVAGTYSRTPIISGRKPIIVIDAGHGGKDPGTRGELGTDEKDLTLSYSLALKNQLEKSGKYKVVLTRGSDRFILLSERVNIARKSGGDVLISIHADSSPNKTTRGFSVYTLSSERADDEAKKLLAQSGREDIIIGASLKGESADVRAAMIDFAQVSTKDISDDFAKTLAKSLGKTIKPLEKNQRQASLAVLTGADIPAVLIELGYLSNKDEERLLKLDEHKMKIVNSINAAVDEYFNKFKLVF